MRAIVADDEQLSRLLMTTLLAREEVHVIAEAESGIQALELCEQFRPDILFCDIRMPDLDGLETAAALVQFDSPPLLVFVTGYSEHAADAFEKAAFDYILKPVSQHRLQLTLTRAEQRLAEKRVIPDLPELRRLPIRTEYAMRLLKVEDVVCAQTQQKRVVVHTHAEQFKTNYTLTQLEQMLPSTEFMRVHASAIARLDEITEINFLGNQTYDLTLSNNVTIPVGRGQYPGLQRRLGLKSIG